MNAVTQALEHLENANKILEDHIQNPMNYNAGYCCDFELKSWELFKIINEIKYISNIYAIA